MVDLGDPSIAEHHRNPRFVARVCTASERTRLAETDDPRTLLWSLFAAKEAAYKVVAKLRPQPVFAHRLFEVAADARTVRYEDLVLHLSVEVDDQRAHAVACTAEQPGLSAVAPAPDGADLSTTGRALLCSALADRLGCDAAELSVVRTPIPESWDGFGPPRVERDGAPIDADVSLSHDGRFVAFAAAV